MYCPRKHGPLEERTMDGVTIDICPSCGGTWFDAREIDKFDEVHEKAGQALLELMESYQNVEIDYDAVLSNPASPEIELVRRYYSPKEKIEIDECPVTGGLWLDGGDLRAIRDTFPTRDDRRRAYRHFAVRWKTSNDIQRMKNESALRAKKADQVTNLMDWLYGY